MIEGQPNYQNPNKVLSPLEKINAGLTQISTAMALKPEEYESLRRYANMEYRIREISFYFNFDYVTGKTYRMDVDGNDRSLKLEIKRDDFRDWRQRMEAQVKKLRQDFFDGNPHMELAREITDRLVKDHEPKI